MHLISVSLLGSSQVLDVHQKEVHFKTRKAQALFFYLLIESGKEHSRAALADLLWPEHSESHGRNNLRQTLYRLRQTFANLDASHRLFQLGRETVQLSASGSLWVDAIAFNRLMTRVKAHRHPPNTLCRECYHGLTRMVELYQGEFLGQFVGGGSGRFETWQTMVRSYYRQQTVYALESILSFSLNDTNGKELPQSHEPAGQPFAQKLMALDPLNEMGVRYALTRQQREGLDPLLMSLYERYCARLREEYHLEPKAELVSLHRALTRPTHVEPSSGFWPAVEVFPRNFSETPNPQNQISEIAHFVAHQTPHLRGSAQLDALAKMEGDWDQVCLGWDAAIEMGDFSFFQKVVPTVVRFFDMTERYRVGGEMLATALHQLPFDRETQSIESELRTGLGWMHFRLGHLKKGYQYALKEGEWEGIERMTSWKPGLTSAKICAALGDFMGARNLLKLLPTVAEPEDALYWKSELMWSENLIHFYEAGGDQQLIEQTMSLKNILGDLWGAALCQSLNAEVAWRHRDAERATYQLTVAVNLWQTICNRRRALAGMIRLGEIEMARQRFERADEWFKKGEVLLAEMGAAACPERLALKCAQGGLLKAVGNSQAALAQFRSGLNLAVNEKAYHQIHPLLIEIGNILESSGRKKRSFDPLGIEPDVDIFNPADRLFQQVRELVSDRSEWRPVVKAMTDVLNQGGIHS